MGVRYFMGSINFLLYFIDKSDSGDSFNNAKNNTFKFSKDLYFTASAYNTDTFS